MRACANCSSANADDALFCAACGHFLEWTDSASTAKVSPTTTTPAGSAPDEPLAPANRDFPAPPEVGDVDPAPPPQDADISAPRVNDPDPPPDLPAAAAPAGGPTAEPTQALDELPIRTPSALQPTPRPSDEAAAGPGAEAVSIAATNLHRGRQMAVARNRPDLAEQLDTARSRLDRRSIAVAIVGEFKRGKSTLLNALLQTAVCPTDADVVTVVPTLVRYGEQPAATAYLEPAPDSTELRTEAVPVDAIKDYVSEDGNPGNRRSLRSLEVQLKHRMLRTGLCLVDTPGVGGLDSAHGLITLSALDLAQAVLFVTDASQELTAPELEFLRSALERCPRAACVMTKTDLYPEWRRIAQTDREHLQRAGIDIPVIPVSSFLRLRARRQPELLEESGFVELVEFLGREVIAIANAEAAAAAANDVQFVASQLDREIAAERTVIEQPAQAQQVVARLREDNQRATQLLSPTATWQQVLSDGMQDLVANVEHDLQERLRGVLRESEGIIDRGDPKDAWDDLQVWLRKQVVAASVANFDTLSAQAQELAAEVAERFSLEAGEPFALQTDDPVDALTGLTLASAESLVAPGGRLGSMLLATRTAVFVPMLLFGVAGSLLGAVIMAPLATVLAAGIGRKLIRDEKKRQIAHRRQQAKLSTRKYVEEVGFIMNKETRDALRRTQRQLRDVFALRARALQSSSTNALAAATRAAALSPTERAGRAADLAAASAQVRAVGAQARALTASVPGGADG